jgi:hypothetical protein
MLTLSSLIAPEQLPESVMVLAEWGVDDSTLGILERSPAQTIRDLLQMSKEEINALPMMGEARYVRLMTALYRYLFGQRLAEAIFLMGSIMLNTQAQLELSSGRCRLTEQINTNKTSTIVEGTAEEVGELVAMWLLGDRQEKTNL